MVETTAGFIGKEDSGSSNENEETENKGDEKSTVIENKSKKYVAQLSSIEVVRHEKPKTIIGEISSIDLKKEAKCIKVGNKIIVLDSGAL